MTTCCVYVCVCITFFYWLSLTFSFLFLFYRVKEQEEDPESVITALKAFSKSIKRKPSEKFILVASNVRESDEDIDSYAEKDDGKTEKKEVS